MQTKKGEANVVDVQLSSSTKKNQKRKKKIEGSIKFKGEGKCQAPTLKGQVLLCLLRL